MNLSYVLKTKRKELGYTLLDIAKEMNVSEATVQRWESGNIKNLRYERISKLAEVLKVSPTQLMGWDEEKENSPVQETDEYKELFKVFSDLDDEGKQRILSFARFEFEARHNKEDE